MFWQKGRHTTGAFYDKNEIQGFSLKQCLSMSVKLSIGNKSSYIFDSFAYEQAVWNLHVGGKYACTLFPGFSCLFCCSNLGG